MSLNLLEFKILKIKSQYLSKIENICNSYSGASFHENPNDVKIDKISAELNEMKKVINKLNKKENTQ